MIEIRNMKHTPGPWTNSSMAMSKKDWAALWHEELTIIQAKGDVVACVWAENSDEEFASARLIAAAPELLEYVVMLEKTIVYSIKQLERKGDDEEGVRLQSMTLAMVRDLIKRVSG